MRKLKIYLDTSVLNFYYAEDSPKERDVTRKLFEEIKNNKYEGFISSTVIREIEEAEESIKNKLIELILKHNLKILEYNEEVDRLAYKYIQNKIVPEKYGLDAFHIAFASVYEIDILASWNFEHIVKLKTKNEVNGINKLEGYREIEICSPWEVIENED